MALKWVEGFETFTTATAVDVSSSLLTKYPDVTSTFTTAEGRFSGFGLSVNLITASNFSTPIIGPTVSPEQTWIIGFAFKLNSAVISSSSNLISILLNGTEQLKLVITTSQKISVMRGGSSLLPIGTTTISTGVWQYLELKTKINKLAGTGSYHVKLNDVTEITSTLNNTANSGSDGANSFKFFGVQGVSFDDIYICDSTGTVNNDFLGGRTSVKLFTPTANGSESDWTGSFSDIDDILSDNDTSYINTSITGDIDLFKFTRNMFDLINVDGIQINSLSRKDDVGDRGIKHVIKADVSGSPTSVENGLTVNFSPLTIVPFPMSDTYVNNYTISETDPDTTSAWTEVALLDAEFGIKLES